MLWSMQETSAGTRWWWRKSGCGISCHHSISWAFASTRNPSVSRPTTRSGTVFHQNSSVPTEARRQDFLWLGGVQESVKGWPPGPNWCMTHTHTHTRIHCTHIIHTVHTHTTRRGIFDCHMTQSTPPNYPRALITLLPYTHTHTHTLCTLLPHTHTHGSH